MALGAGGYSRWSQQQPLSGGIETTGSIQSVQQTNSYDRGRESTTYASTVQFTDKAGQSITFVGPQLSSYPKLAPNGSGYAPVRVSYNPHNPSNAHLLGNASGDLATIYTGIGLGVIALLYSAVLIRKVRRYGKWYPLGRFQRRFPLVKRVVPRAEDNLAPRTKILDVYEGSVNGVSYQGKLVVDANGIGIDTFEVCAPAPLRILVRAHRHYVVKWKDTQACTVAPVLAGARSAAPGALGDVRVTVKSADHDWSVVVPDADATVVQDRLKQYYASVTAAV